MKKAVVSALVLAFALASVTSAVDPNTLPGRGNQPGTSHTPDGNLSAGTIYCWRIDAVKSQNTVKGNVWSFTTVS